MHSGSQQHCPPAVLCVHTHLQSQAKALSQRLGLLFFNDRKIIQEQAELVLELDAQSQYQLWHTQHNFTPLCIDFTSGQYRHRRLYGGGKSQSIAKAIGINKHNPSPSVIDATAGLGQDSFTLASLGCQVTMIERSPILGTMLEAAIEQAKLDNDSAAIIERIQLIQGNAIEQIKTLPQADVILLDPMFPERQKTALVKKSMRMIKTLVGTDPDADTLLPTALRHARKRVVVKRPKHAPYLNNQKPDAQRLGKSGRWDIYFPTKAHCPE